MKVLITGGLGFIGSHLGKLLESAGNEVAYMDRVRRTLPNYHRGDICDYYRMEDIFEEVRPDVVYHLAAMVSRKECEETPLLAIQANVDGTMNICRLAAKHNSRLIYSGSSEEYGEAFFNNKYVTEKTPFGKPTSFYSMTKRMSEEVVEYYTASADLVAITTRFFMLYGSGEESSDYRSAVSRFINAALRNSPLKVHEGTERSWCHISDAIEALYLMANVKLDSYTSINIGRNEPILTEDLARRIINLIGSNSDIEFVERDKTIIPIKRANFGYAKKLLGWESKICLYDGLRMTIGEMK
jgi:nucleoside-diphosphate-sugar epimerase